MSAPSLKLLANSWSDDTCHHMTVSKPSPTQVTYLVPAELADRFADTYAAWSAAHEEIHEYLRNYPADAPRYFMGVRITPTTEGDLT